MTEVVHKLWAPLAVSPLPWLALTLGAYLIGRLVQRHCGGAAYASPVLIAIIIVAAAVVATGTAYPAYFAGTQFIHFLLGPATVALGVPLACNLHHVRRSLHGIGLAQVAGRGELAAAFAALGIGLNGLTTALLAPLLSFWQ